MPETPRAGLRDIERMLREAAPSALAVLALWRYPITEARASSVRRELESRRDGSLAVAATVSP